MADLLPKERLQPSLLDRLIDANPKGKVSAAGEMRSDSGSPASENGDRSGREEDSAQGNGAASQQTRPAAANEKADEEREPYFWSVSKLRQSVIRDLEWLLNTGNLELSEDLSAYPYAAGSVINYGIPDLVGGSLSGFDKGKLERRVREAIWNFEPRILKHSLKVRIHARDRSQSRNALSMEIEGEVWSQPVPLHVFLQAEVNVETGKVNFSQTATPGSG